MAFSNLTLKLAKAVAATWQEDSDFYGMRCRHCEGQYVFDENDVASFNHDLACPASYAKKILTLSLKSS